MLRIVPVDAIFCRIAGWNREITRQNVHLSGLYFPQAANGRNFMLWPDHQRLRSILMLS